MGGLTMKTDLEGLDVIGYGRVSMEEQATKGASLEMQELKIRQHCATHDLNLLRVVLDPGFSGKDLDRPGITEVLECLRQRKGGADGVVIYKLDRLTRSLRDWADLITEFFGDKGQKRLLSVNDSIDTGTAGGRMVLNVLMSVAQWEREIIGERTRDALQAKIGRGERCGKIRYGYDLAPDGRTLVRNEREQETIRVMQEWKAAGKSYREMVKLVEDLGIETKEGNRLWVPSTIHRILTRPVA
jgi:site-specific DNA recombinase